MGYNSYYQKLACWLLLLPLLVFVQGNAQSPYSYTRARSKSNQSLRLQLPNQSVSQEKQSLLSALKELNRSKGLYFLFSEESMGNVMVKATKEQEGDIEKILNEILKDTGLKYKKISSNTI